MRVLFASIVSLVFLIASPGGVGAQVCGDGMCEEGEDIGTCSEDCNITGVSGPRFGGNLLEYGKFDFRTTQEQLDAFHALLEDLGMEATRINLYWGMLEESKGIFNWTIIDEQLTGLDSNMSILFTLHSTSDWGSSEPANASGVSCRQILADYDNVDVSFYDNRNPDSMPMNMQDYMDFLDAIVNRYKDRVKHWQIENEAHGSQYSSQYQGCQMNRWWIGGAEEYVELLMNSYAKIKEVDPEAQVLLSSIMRYNGNVTFTDYMLEHGEGYYDILDFHLYRCPQDDAERINEILSQISSFGYSRPESIWVTEHGEIDIQGCHPGPPFNESFDSPEELKLQSEEVVKRYVLAFSSRVQRIHRLTLNDQNDEWNNPAKRWQHMPLTFNVSGSNKKPGYFTNKLLIGKLRDFISLEKISQGVYKFSFSGKEPVFVLWSDSGETFFDLSDYVSSDEVNVSYIVIELDQNNHPIIPPSDVVSANSVKINETPIFVEENTCQNQGYHCCYECAPGNEHSQYDNDCTGKVCCTECSNRDLCMGIVILMHFDKNQQYGENYSHVFDFSNHGNNGTVHGASWSSTEGMFQGAFDFDGLDDNIVIRNDPSFNEMTEFSVSAWFRANSIDSGQWISDKRTRLKFAIESPGILRFRSVNNTVYADSDNPINVNQWYHAVGTFDGTLTKLFMDGQEQQDIGTGSGFSAYADMAIGSKYDSSSSFFNGTIDEVAVWNRTLLPEEIQDIFDSGSQIHCGIIHRADTREPFGSIDMEELFSFIDSWKYDSTEYPMSEMMEAVVMYYSP